MSVVMGSRKAIDLLVKDKVTGRFGLTEWGGEDYETDYDEYLGEPVDLDDGDALYGDEAERRKEVGDKLMAAYDGTYDEKYGPTGTPKKKTVAAAAAQRSRALRAAEAQPAYKGVVGPRDNPKMPEKLARRGYALRRNDNGYWFARGRGRNIIKGNVFETPGEAIQDAYADLAVRGEPAPSRSKKAKAGVAHEPVESTGEAPEQEEEVTEYQEPPNPAEAPLEAADMEAKAEEAFYLQQIEGEKAEYYETHHEERPGYNQWDGEGLEEGEPSQEELEAVAEVAQEQAEEERTRQAINHADDLASSQAKLEWVAVGKLRLEWEAQSRVAIADETIATYQEDFERYGGWGAFPPVKAAFDGEHYWVYDGYQRITAYQRSRAGGIVPALVVAGGYRDAILLSTGVNFDHGLRRSRADTQNAITKLLKDQEWRGWSDAQIARHVRVDPKTVGNIRKRLEANREIPDSLSRKTADGHTVTVAKREIKPLPPRHEPPQPKPATVVYEPGESMFSDIIDFGEYRPLIAAGFVLERRRNDPELLVRWAWPQDTGRAYTGDWVKTAVKACDEAVRWHKHHAPAIEANLAAGNVPEPPIDIVAKLRKIASDLAEEGGVMLGDLAEARQGWYHDLVTAYIPSDTDPALLAAAAKVVIGERVNPGPLVPTDASARANAEAELLASKTPADLVAAGYTILRVGDAWGWIRRGEHKIVSYKQFPLDQVITGYPGGKPFANVKTAIDEARRDMIAGGAFANHEDYYPHKGQPAVMPAELVAAGYVLIDADGNENPDGKRGYNWRKGDQVGPNVAYGGAAIEGARAHLAAYPTAAILSSPEPTPESINAPGSKVWTDSGHTPRDLADEGILIEEPSPSYFRWIDTDEAKYRVGALHDSPEQAIASARKVFGIYEDNQPALRACRVCGCTDDRACEGGCWWVEPDLCSACASRVEGHFNQSAPADLAAAFTLPLLPSNPTNEERIATGRYYLELYRTTLRSLNEYSRLTGKYVETLQFHRDMMPLIDHLKSFLALLGDVIVIEKAPANEEVDHGE